MKERQHGFLLVAAVILIVIVGVLAAAIFRIVTTQGHATVDRIHATQAFYIANSGLNATVYALQHGTSCKEINGRRNFTNVAFAQGRFTVTTKLIQSIEVNSDSAENSPTAEENSKPIIRQQCQLIVVAAVPNFLHPQAKRRVSENIDMIIHGKDDNIAIVAILFANHFSHKVL